MKKGFRAEALTLAVTGLTLVSCAESEDFPQAPPPDVQGVLSELIGGVEANSPALDAIGILGVTSTYVDCYSGQRITQDRPVCTASLIGERTVLTAKHCVEGLGGGGYDSAPFFALGPDATHPTRKIEIIDVERSPVDYGGFNELGRDVAVVHLASSVTDVRPLRYAPLLPTAVGSRYGAIGYGIQNNSYVSGTRRAGNVTVNALEGRVYELIFGSFEAYREWYLSTMGWYPGGPIVIDDEPSPIGVAIDGGVPSTPVARDGAVTPPTRDGGSVDGGFSDYQDSYLRSLYENTRLLPGYEAYVGNRSGDAQLCNGDSGSPLVQSVDGELVAYGVVSGGIDSRELVCDYGAVYATFGPETIAFLDQALQYIDPCDGASTSGTCSGSVATRCTNIDEGKRRLTVTDCALLGQTCATASNGNAVCATPGEVPVVLPEPSYDYCEGFPGGPPIAGGGVIIDDVGVVVVAPAGPAVQ